jgi:acyl dehydratase
METEAVDTTTGEPVVSTRLGYFIRGAGGFGGQHGDSSGNTPWCEPDGEPHESIVVPTRGDLALLYRLNGDRNRLHSDPASAAAAGFPRPILHGLATYGIATRVLMDRLLSGEPARLDSISARFTTPVYPGDTLVIHVWRTEAGAVFRMVNGTGDVVLDRGTLTGDFLDRHPQH